MKKEIEAANVGEVLARLRELPISTWTYVTEPSGVRHLGPMAQDFRASFGLGNDEKSYQAVDGHGVALAAVQALDRLVEQQQRRIDSLERKNEEFGRLLRALTGGTGPALRTAPLRK